MLIYQQETKTQKNGELIQMDTSLNSTTPKESLVVTALWMLILFIRLKIWIEGEVEKWETSRNNWSCINFVGGLFAKSCQSERIFYCRGTSEISEVKCYVAMKKSLSQYSFSCSHVYREVFYEPGNKKRGRSGNRVYSNMVYR